MEETRERVRNINPETIRVPENENDCYQEKKENKFNSKNYLDIKLEDGMDEKTIKIRLLPIDGTSGILFKKIQSHSIQLSSKLAKAMKLGKNSKGFKSFYCLNETTGLKEEFGHDCPFCEKRWELFNKSNEEGMSPEESKNWKRESCKYIPFEGAIFRCIERGKESEGPKFVKINLHGDKSDLYHALIKIYESRKNESIEEAMEKNNGVLPEGFIPYNVFDLYNGKDFEITVTRVKSKTGNDLERTSMTVMDCGNPKPMVYKDGKPDYERIDAWLDDEKTWDSVFTAKPYDYLAILMEDKYPFFDSNNQKWIGLDVDDNGRWTLPWAKKAEEERAEKEQEMDDDIEAAKREVMGNPSNVMEGDFEF